MGHFGVVFVKTKIFYGPFNFCMGIYTELQNCMYQTAHGPCLSQSLCTTIHLSKHLVLQMMFQVIEKLKLM